MTAFFNGIFQSASGVLMETFGEPVTVVRDDGHPVTVTGVFDPVHEYTKRDAAGVPVSSVRPQVDIPSWKMPWEIEQGDRIEIRGIRYTVSDILPDGSGYNMFVLHKDGG